MAHLQCVPRRCMQVYLDSWPRGTSFVAHLKRNGKPNIGNLHGVCHNVNLGVKEAMAANPWSILWMDHVRAVFNWFSKSPARKSKFASLSEELTLLGNVVTWKMVYPKYYCPTRWVGIYMYSPRQYCGSKRPARGVL